MRDDDGRDASLVPSSCLLPARAALVTRGIELAMALLADGAADIPNATTYEPLSEPIRWLYEAWIDFARGCDNAAEKGVIGLLIDAFDDGVYAATAWLGIKDDNSPIRDLYREMVRVAAAEAIIAGTESPFSLKTGRLISRMTKLKDSDDSDFQQAAAHIVNNQRAEFVDELETFLEEVAALIEPSKAATSFEYVAMHWYEVQQRVNASRKPTVVSFTLPEIFTSAEAAAAGGDLLILRVLVKPGDSLAEGQAVLELETNKATIEVPSTMAGRVTMVNVKSGDKVKGGQLVLTLVEDAASTLRRLAFGIIAANQETVERPPRL
jgi:biotin carboxyl carrier protein